MRSSESDDLVTFDAESAFVVESRRLSVERELERWYVGEEDGGRMASLLAAASGRELDLDSLGGGVSRG